MLRGRVWKSAALSAVLLSGVAVRGVPSASARTSSGAQAVAASSVVYPFAYVSNSAANTVTRVGLGFGVVGKPIPVGSDPVAIAITPDDRKAYVVNQGSNSVTPINTFSGTAGAPIAVGNSPVALAITPDGTTVYVVNRADGTVTPISTATNTAGTPIEIDSVFPNLNGIAISPDGTTGYVQNGGLGGDIVPFDVATGVRGEPFGVGESEARFGWLAVSPDGHRLVLADDLVFGGGSPSLSWRDPTNPVDGNGGFIIGLEPTAVAMTPDGGTAFTADSGSGTVSVFSFAAEAVTSINVGGSPRGVAVSPDGKMLWVTDATSGHLIRVTIATGAHTFSIPVGSSLDGLAIAPDQAPVARLTVTPALHGHPSAFDASSSWVAFGRITKYAWRFGDGTAATTTTPTTTHTYSAAHGYTARVTETDSAGTSTTLVFTGQTVSRRGGTSASATATFTVS